MVFSKLMKVTSTALKKPITLVCVFLTLLVDFLHMIAIMSLEPLVCRMCGFVLFVSVIRSMRVSSTSTYGPRTGNMNTQRDMLCVCWLVEYCCLIITLQLNTRAQSLD